MKIHDPNQLYKPNTKVSKVRRSSVIKTYLNINYVNTTTPGCIKHSECYITGGKVDSGQYGGLRHIYQYDPEEHYNSRGLVILHRNQTMGYKNAQRLGRRLQC